MGSSKAKNYKISMCCFSAKHTSVRRKGNYWFARNQNNAQFLSNIIIIVHASSAVDRGFIGSVMVSVHASSAVDRGFIGSVMVSVHASSAVDRGFIGSVMVCVHASSA